MSKAISEGKLRRVFGVYQTNLRPDGIGENVLDWIFQNPVKGTQEFAIFLKKGGHANIPVGSESKVGDSDFILHINRRKKLVYPDFVENPLYPNLEAKGPKRFDVNQLEHWLHPSQKQGVVKGTVIHDYLKSNGLLETCLGLRELEAIKAKGLDFFRCYFQGKILFGWKGVVLDRGGYLFVPYLVEDGGRVVLFWVWLENGWRASSLALRFAK